MPPYAFYVAGPLFNAYEQTYQAELAQRLAPLGRVFLPQAEIPAAAEAAEVFERCCRGVDESRIIVANLSGADADSGTAFEVGYAFARGKPIYAVRSELAYRFADRAIYPNLMLRGAVVLTADIEELVDRLRSDYRGGFYPMPLGRTHDRITWWTAPAVGGVVFYLGCEARTALIVAGAYLFSGLMFGGDLDIHSVQYRRWGPLRWIWLPYRRLVTHRSLLSHGPLVGTLGRLLYLGVAALLLGAIVLAVGQAMSFNLAWEQTLKQLRQWLLGHGPLVIWTFVGLELGSMSHSLSDWLGSAWKRLVSRRYGRGHR